MVPTETVGHPSSALNPYQLRPENTHPPGGRGVVFGAYLSQQGANTLMTRPRYTEIDNMDMFGEHAGHTVWRPSGMPALTASVIRHDGSAFYVEFAETRPSLSNQLPESTERAQNAD